MATGFLWQLLTTLTWVEPWNVKNAPQWNKCILTSRLTTSSTVATIYPRVFPVFVFLAKTRVSRCPIIYKVFSFRCATRPRATCGTLPSRWVSMRTNSVLTPCKARCGTFTLPRNVKSDFFRAKTFNIFYIFGREKFSISSIRAPIKPRKFPIKHLENPIKHLEFPTSDVFLPL